MMTNGPPGIVDPRRRDRPRRGASRTRSRASRARVRVVGEQRAPRRGARTGDHPTVAAAWPGPGRQPFEARRQRLPAPCLQVTGWTRPRGDQERRTRRWSGGNVVAGPDDRRRRAREVAHQVVGLGRAEAAREHAAESRPAGSRRVATPSASRPKANRWASRAPAGSRAPGTRGDVTSGTSRRSRRSRPPRAARGQPGQPETRRPTPGSLRAGGRARGSAGPPGASPRRTAPRGGRRWLAGTPRSSTAARAPAGIPPRTRRRRCPWRRRGAPPSGRTGFRRGRAARHSELAVERRHGAAGQEAEGEPRQNEGARRPKHQAEPGRRRGARARGVTGTRRSRPYGKKGVGHQRRIGPGGFGCLPPLERFV